MREWEFIEGEGIDPTDSFGVNLRLSIREDQIFLAEPSSVDTTPWLTDRGRLFFDGMFEKNVSEDKVNWNTFFSSLSESIYFFDHLNLQRRNSLSFLVVFENVSLEIINMLYLIEQSYSFIKLRKAENFNIENDFEASQLNSTLNKSKLLMSNLGIVLNTNTRHEGYVLNLNLRQRFLKGDFKLLYIGSILDITLPVSNLGSNMSVFKSIGEGVHLSCQDIKNSDFPLLITNTELFKRKDSKNLIKMLKYTGIVKTAWNGLNILNHNISSVGINSLNSFLPISSEDFGNFFGLYFINTSLNSVPNIKKLIDLQLLNISSSSTSSSAKFFIDQNNNQDNKYIYEKLESEVVQNYHYLPNNLFLEDNESFVNTQGLVKRVTKLISFKKDSKSNWQIIRKFYANSKNISYLNNKQDNNIINFDCVNVFNYKNYVNFQFNAVSALTSLSFYLNKQNKPIIKTSNTPIKTTQTKIFNTKLKNWLDDFFMGNGKDSFSYNSSVMAKSSKIIRLNSTNFF